MPIRASQKARYPKNWKAISLAIRVQRAGGRCECAGECGLGHVWEGERRCPEENGALALWALMDNREVKVVLTVAHLDHQPENCDPKNLKAMCQRCHLRYDHDLHQKNARETREAANPTPRML